MKQSGAVMQVIIFGGTAGVLGSPGFAAWYYL